MRGHRVRLPGRFIPAPAGNSFDTGLQRLQITVHPRACGEQVRVRRSTAAYFGSSPRLRGTALEVAAPYSHDRFIPAPAGNRPRPPCSRTACSVHPRACGEQMGTTHQQDQDNGSSPRLRGTANPPKPGQLPGRFIPAPAGNRIFCPSSFSTLSVHPRACGEQCRDYRRRCCCSGSSPRLRGTGLNLKAEGLHLRFIPAPAGNSFKSRTCLSPASVHPRACGEQAPTATTTTMTIGSSPRLRGTGKTEHRSALLHRFIPAPAGNRVPTILFPCPAPVHPRACGEQDRPCRALYTLYGSSPRLRGTADPPSAGMPA